MGGRKVFFDGSGVQSHKIQEELKKALSLLSLNFFGWNLALELKPSNDDKEVMYTTEEVISILTSVIERLTMRHGALSIATTTEVKVFPAGPAGRTYLYSLMPKIIAAVIKAAKSSEPGAVEEALLLWNTKFTGNLAGTDLLLKLKQLDTRLSHITRIVDDVFLKQVSDCLGLLINHAIGIFGENLTQDDLRVYATYVAKAAGYGNSDFVASFALATNQLAAALVKSRYITETLHDRAYRLAIVSTAATLLVNWL